MYSVGFVTYKVSQSSESKRGAKILAGVSSVGRAAESAVTRSGVQLPPPERQAAFAKRQVIGPGNGLGSPILSRVSDIKLSLDAHAGAVPDLYVWGLTP